MFLVGDGDIEFIVLLKLIDADIMAVLERAGSVLIFNTQTLTSNNLQGTEGDMNVPRQWSNQHPFAQWHH